MTAEKPQPTGRLYGRDSLATPAMVVATGLVVAFGGYLVPVLGWFAGIVMMWLSPVWTRGQKLVATLTPVIFAALVAAMFLSSAVLPGLHAFLVLAIISPLPIGIWLLVIGLRRIGSRS